MTRRFKVLGALLAALALGGLATQSAAAAVDHSFTSDSPTGTTVLTGTTEPGTKEIWSLPFPIECEDISYRGTMVGNTTDHISVFPDFSKAKCTVANLVVAPDNNGCTLTYDSDTFENSTHFAMGQEHANVSMACGHSGNITITVPGCTITMSTTHSGGVIVNHNLPGARYTAIPNHSGGKTAMTVTTTAKTMKTSTIGANCLLIGLGSPGTQTNLVHSSLVALTGYVDADLTTKNPDTDSLSEGALVNIGLSTP